MTSKKQIKPKDIHIDININYDNSTNDDKIKYTSLKKKQNENYIDPYRQIHFLDHNNYRVILHPSSIPSQLNSHKFEFNDCFLIRYYNHDSYTCPICFKAYSQTITDEIQKELPWIITHCGHVFCWVCIVEYVNHCYLNSMLFKKSIKPLCPLCKVDISTCKFKFCEVIYNKKYKEKDEEEDEKQVNSISNKSSSSLSFMTFNLITRHNFLIYNIKYDSNLELLKSKYKSIKIAYFNDKLTLNSRIFQISYKDLIEKLVLYKKSLEDELNKETMDFYKDDRTIESILCCISELESIISENKVLYDKKENENIEELEIEKEKDWVSKLKYLYQEEFGDSLYLHPINFNVLLSEYGTVENFPSTIYVSNVYNINIICIYYRDKY